MEKGTRGAQKEQKEDLTPEDSLNAGSVPSAEAAIEGGESVPKSAEDLLDGLTVVFTDYPDCMDMDTMDKWKQVRLMHTYATIDVGAWLHYVY